MVDRLRAAGIDDERVLAAMAQVPRERFVPAALAEDAYDDRPLPIGNNQTISAPWIVAFMTAALGLSPAATVLEIGTGRGYAAAVLSRCARTVVTIERHRELAELARETLRELGYHNVEVRAGDGSLGAPDRAPFDAISVTAMAARQLPAALVEQLAAGGMLLCPVGEGTEGVLVRYREGRSEKLVPVGFVPLVPGEPRSGTGWRLPWRP